MFYNFNYSINYLWNIRKNKEYCKEGEKMVEEIEDKLKDIYEFLTIEVEYVNIKTYKIYISCQVIDFRDSETIKGVEFYHNWQDNLTFTSNIEIIKHHIDNALIRFFKKERKD